MNDAEDPGDFFAPPAFKADEALVQLRRQLRDLKLREQGGGAPGSVLRFSLKALDVAELQALDGEAVIQAAIVKRPGARPEWQRTRLDSSVAVRKWIDELRRQLTRWSDDD